MRAPARAGGAGPGAGAGGAAGGGGGSSSRRRRAISGGAGQVSGGIARTLSLDFSHHALVQVREQPRLHPPRRRPTLRRDRLLQLRPLTRNRLHPAPKASMFRSSRIVEPKVSRRGLTYGSCARLHRGKVVAPHARQRAGRGILLLLLLNRLTPAPSRGAGTLGLRLRRRVEAVSAGICASQQASFSVAAYLGVPERVEGALGLAREAGPERVERHTLAQDRAAHTQQARQAKRGTPKECSGLVPWGPPARSRARGLSPRAGRALPAPLPSASPWPRSGSPALGTGCAALREGGG